MKDEIAVSMFGQKRLSREGGVEIVVKELCTRMAVVKADRAENRIKRYENKLTYRLLLQW